MIHVPKVKVVKNRRAVRVPKKEEDQMSSPKKVGAKETHFIFS